MLLTKSDKLKRNAARAAQDKARKLLGTEATVQLFSSQDGEGLADGRRRLAAMLG